MLCLLSYSKRFVMSLCISTVIILSYGYYITFIILRWCIDVHFGVLNVVFAHIIVNIRLPRSDVLLLIFIAIIAV